MKSLKLWTVASILGLSTLAGSGIAAASPTDGSFPWSYGGLRVADVIQGGDNDVYVRFRNPDGSIRKLWTNSTGADICGGADALRLSRARTNFSEVVAALNGAGLSGRSVWVAYEPTGSVCYIKSLSVSLQ